jgi:hypothetical protein
MLKRVFALLTACLIPSAILAKCGNSAIVIKGLITGSIDGSTVSVQVVPDPNWEPQPAIVIESNGQFEVSVYFDRTEAGHVRESCSRKPRTVTVQLRRNGRLIDQVALEITRDFVSEHNTDYKLRSPVTLHSK